MIYFIRFSFAEKFMDKKVPVLKLFFFRIFTDKALLLDKKAESRINGNVSF